MVSGVRLAVMGKQDSQDKQGNVEKLAHRDNQDSPVQLVLEERQEKLDLLAKEDNPAKEERMVLLDQLVNISFA